MWKALVFALVVALVVPYGCGKEAPAPTTFDQASETPALAKKDKRKGGGGDDKGAPLGTCPNIYYESSKTLKNGATVTWTSSFGGFDHSQGAGHTVTVSWSVEGGSATFTSFTAKRKTWTPKGVAGTWSYNAGTNELTVNMSDMHRSVEPDWQGYIGNGHFKLELDVDGEKAKLGVNVHLEDPDDGYASRCPLPS